VGPPSRTLGLAFSDGDRTSRIAGAIVTADGVVDGLEFGRCTVGGTDATDALVDLWAALDREDVRHVACAGAAPAWFNLLDLRRLSETISRPVSAVSYEESSGLEPALREAFDGEALADRLKRIDRSRRGSAWTKPRATRPAETPCSSERSESTTTARSPRFAGSFATGSDDRSRSGSPPSRQAPTARRSTDTATNDLRAVVTVETKRWGQREEVRRTYHGPGPIGIHERER